MPQTVVEKLSSFSRQLSATVVRPTSQAPAITPAEEPMAVGWATSPSRMGDQARESGFGKLWAGW